MPDEMLDVVTEDDLPTGQAPRAAVHARGLWHRGVHVFLFDGRGRLLVQKRSAERVASPSLLDGSVSEHVKAGEDYLDGARRGLEEELGVSRLDFEPVATFRMVYGPRDNKISTLFHAVVDFTDVQFDPEEIEAVAWRGVDELLEQMKNEPTAFCGWFVEILHWYMGTPSALTVLYEHTRMRFSASGSERPGSVAPTKR